MTNILLLARDDLTYESLDRVICTLVALMLDEVLKKCYAVKALGNLGLDERTMRFATASADGFG